MFKLCLLVVAALSLSPQAVKGQLVGADDAEPREFRYYAFIRINNNFFCSGALIRPKHILSAGHCVDEAKKHVNEPLNALLGTKNPTSGGTVYTIATMVHHPSFVRQTTVTDWTYDIGIFTLERDVMLSDLIDIVGLVTSDYIVPGSRAVVPGAGYVEDRGPASQVLQKLKVAILNTTDCKYKMPAPFYIGETLICTFGNKGKGICNGDSGAPLVQNGVIIGIAAGFIRPCGGGYPDFYSNVYKYQSWITEVTGQ